MKKGFTIVEVAILFVIFLIVAFLVAPLSLDDTMQAKNTSNWRRVQQDFTNIFYNVNVQKNDEDLTLKDALSTVISNEVKDSVKPYRITYLNGTYPSNTHRFNEFKQTYSNAILSLKFFEEPQDNVQGVLMYDINGQVGPNKWGKDVFGFNIYDDKFEPFCKNKPINEQKQDCSKHGTGLCCSNYYLIGGSFD